MPKKTFFTIAFISWMVLITWLSLFSFSEPDLPKIEIPHLDKLVHFTFYFVASILGVMSIWERAGTKMNIKKGLIIIVLGTIIYGIIIEVIQYTLTSDRMGDVLDALSNSIGALSGALVVKNLFSGKRRLKWKD